MTDVPEDDPISPREAARHILKENDWEMPDEVFGGAKEIMEDVLREEGYDV